MCVGDTIPDTKSTSRIKGRKERVCWYRQPLLLLPLLWSELLNHATLSPPEASETIHWDWPASFKWLLFVTATEAQLIYHFYNWLYYTTYKFLTTMYPRFTHWFAMNFLSVWLLNCRISNNRGSSDPHSPVPVSLQWLWDAMMCSMSLSMRLRQKLSS